MNATRISSKDTNGKPTFELSTVAQLHPPPTLTIGPSAKLPARVGSAVGGERLPGAENPTGEPSENYLSPPDQSAPSFVMKPRHVERKPKPGVLCVNLSAGSKLPGLSGE